MHKELTKNAKCMVEMPVYYSGADEQAYGGGHLISDVFTLLKIGCCGGMSKHPRV